MTMILTEYMRVVSDAEDQKQAILDWFGEIKDIVLNDDVMVATYVRRGYYVTKYGQKIQLTDDERVENRYQGKVGLLLKCGPQAFRFNKSFDYIAPLPDETQEEFMVRRRLHTPKVGDWVLYRAADGFEAGFRGGIVRTIPSECIRCIVDNPMDWY